MAYYQITIMATGEKKTVEAASMAEAGTKLSFGMGDYNKTWWAKQVSAPATTTTPVTTTPPATTTPSTTPATTTPSAATSTTATSTGSAAIDKIISDYVKVAEGWGTSGLELVTAIMDYVKRQGYTVTEDQVRKALGASSTGAGTFSQDSTNEYNAYLAFIKTDEGKSYPVPKNINDYFTNKVSWAGQTSAGGGEEGEGGTQYTDDQIREFNNYKQWYYSFGQPGDWMPVSVEDYFANYDKAQSQLATWQQLSKQKTAEQTTYDQYIEEQRARAEYAAKEAYGEPPMYSEKFASWIKGQGGISESLRGYIENKYPSLKAEYEAGLPRQTGYATREEARAEAVKRETGFQNWLSQQTPELKQQYYTQRPTARGERPYIQSPTLRAVNW